VKRSSERLIDVLVLSELLVFAWLMRAIQPVLAGVIVAHAVQFWMAKNAAAPHPSIDEAAAKAAAEVLKVARQAAEPETPGEAR
jgi:hypothetical protein